MTKNKNKKIQNDKKENDTKKCHKWLLLNDDISREYNISIIICKNCKNYAFPYFVHSEFGDYTCHICEGDGDLQQYCVYCKQRKDV